CRRQMYRAQPILRAPPEAVEKYTFNPALDKRQWEVLSDVELHINQQQYDLTQFHTHVSAEHSIDGIIPALELHFVFEKEGQPTIPGNEEGFGVVAVIAFLAQLGNRTSTLLQ